ncbi:MAG TPA: FadR/GntR family transcriptional regulator [Terriglobia bacterium]|nr:FadR/GntR family transcriptional regulator [Terriglobia bacterium]
MLRNLKPVFRVTLSQQVATQLAEMISAGKWKSGDKLPSEAGLCKSFHVGRSTLREALKSLAFVGLLRMKAGEGTYVTDGSPTLLGNAFVQGLLKTEKELDDLCEVRFLLELDTVAQCARRGSDQDIQKLQSLVSEMHDAMEQGDRFLSLDLQFHISIADASQNRVLAQLLRTIRDLLQDVIIKSQKAPGSRELAYNQHMEILKAVKQRNPRLARTAMRNHLKTFQRAFKIVVRSPDKAAAQASPSHHHIADSVANSEWPVSQTAIAKD